MQIPEYIKELLKNPTFKDLNIKDLENSISKKFDRDLCKQESIIPKEITRKCVYPLTLEERKKKVREMLPPSDDIRDARVPSGINSITEAGKYINPKFSPDEGNEKCINECINNITKLVDKIKDITVKNTNEYKKLDKYLSDYYASSALLHNAFYSLYTYYKYANKNSHITWMRAVIDKMKYKNTTNSVVGKYFINKTNILHKEYLSIIDNGYLYYYKNYTRSTAITTAVLVVSVQSRKDADKNLKDALKDISNQISLKTNQVEYNINSQKIKSGVVNTIIKEYELEPTENEAKDYNFIKNKENKLYKSLTTNDATIRNLFNTIKYNSKAIGFNFYTISGDKYKSSFITLVSNFGKKHDSTIALLENVDITNVTKSVKNDISQIFCCGQQLKVPDDKEVNYNKDSNNRTYSGVNDKSDISKSEYWKEFTKYLNLIALIPIYWRNGIILPNGVKIPLPIIFIHIITIKVGPIIIVIWLTINGLVIVPVIYILQFEPIGNATSTWLVLFRGVNKKIKDETGVEILNIPTIGGINVNPELSKILPFKKDDLPTIERMGITNPLYLVYLNQMMLKIKSGMGLP